MRNQSAPARYRAWLLVGFIAFLGCRAPGPGTATDRAGEPLGPSYLVGTDARKAGLPLEEVPDAPQPPASVDLSTRPAMPPPVLRRYTDAKAMFEDHRYAEAVLELEKALRYDQAQYDVLRLLSLSCYLSGNEAKARLRARETLKLNPRDEAARFVLARSALKSGQRDEALRELRAILLCPPEPAAAAYRTLAHLHLGLLLDDLGYARAALTQFDAFEKSAAGLSEAQRAHPELAAAAKTADRTLSLRRARALARLGDFAAAAEAIAPIAAGAPGDAALQSEYIQLLLHANRKQQAIDVARAHVRQESASPASVDLLLSARRWSGQDAQIVQDLREIANMYPDRLDLSLLLARTLLDADQLAGAADVLRTVRQRHPQEIEPAWLLADILRRQNRWRDWIMALAELVAVHEEQYARVQQAVAELSADVRAAAAASRRVAEAARDMPDAWAVLFVTAAVAERSGDDRAAELQYRRAVELRPDRVPSSLALGELLARQYRWQEAAATGRAILQTGRKAAQLEWLTGYALDALDDWDGAGRHYKAALELNPKDLRTLRSYAMLSERMGDAKKAQALWRDLLAVDPHDTEARERLLRGCVARGEMTTAAAQLLELKEQLGTTSPVYQRCEALLKLLRTRSESGSREYREQLAQIIKAFPRDVRTREDYAGLLFSSRKYREAAEQAEEILRIEPSSLVAMELRALLAVRALDYKAAAEAFGELLRRYPNREGWNRSLAEIYLMELDYDRAAEILHRLMGLPAARARLAEYRASLLSLYQDAGRLEQMRKAAEEWLAATPDDPAARLLVLAADEAARDFDSIVRRCRAWIQADARPNPEWRKRLIDALNQAHRYSEAEALVLRWISEEPKDLSALRWLADVLTAARRHEDAVEWIRNLAAGESIDKPATFALLYRAQLAAKDYDGAIASLKELSRQNENASVDGDIARILIEAGRFEDAENYLNKLIDRAESGAARAALLRTLSFCYQKQKRTALAEQRMQEALKLAPDDAGINNDLGYTWADAGRNLDEAESMLRYAVGESPREAAYLDSLGWVYYKKGEFAKALMWLTRAAAESNGNDPVIYDHLGDTLWRLGQADAARKRWQQAVDTAKERADRGLGEHDVEAIENTRRKLAAMEQGAKPVVAAVAGEPRPSPEPAEESPTR